MGLLEKDVENVLEKLQTWKPGPLASEKDYEEAAYKFLNGCFPKDKFERQYSRGKTKADLYVEFKDAAKVVVELKRDLKERGEYHRLVGQVYEYLTEWRVEVLVVLCGDNDPALTKNVENYIGFMNERVKPKVRFLHVPCNPPTAT